MCVIILVFIEHVLTEQAMLNLPSHIGVTANLSINYKSPCQADQVRNANNQKQTLG